MKTGYMVCDAMTKAPIVVSTGTSIQDCAVIMQKHDIGSLLIKKDHSLKGIITDEDIVRSVVAKGLDPKKIIVDDHMAKRLITIEPNEDIFAALMLMMEEDIRQLPVLDGKKMLGLLTLKDILRIEPELFDLIVDKINIKEEDQKPIDNEGICEECGAYAKKLLTRSGALICKKCFGAIPVYN
jgi:signal-transduction protein with cAMP-binding, CBS, and nucleotidyltransferase domain